MSGARIPLLALLLLLLPLAATRLAGAADAPAVAAQESADPEYDLLIRGGHVLDGTGNPWFRADVAVQNGRIVAVGRLDGADARRVVDVGGKVVAPGFIDIHSHAGGSLADENERRRAAPNLVAQGVTTVAVNQDGRSPWPIAEQRAELEARGFGPNAALMVGHGQLRREVMGDDAARPATDREVDGMRELMVQALDEGALGLSAALEYNPGRYAETEELVRIMEEVARRDGVYISHQRSEGSDPMWWWPSQHEPGPPNLLESVLETIEIGERTGAVVVASHIKAKGAHYWGSSHAAIRLIEAARARGVRVYADLYSYNTSGSDGNAVLVPGWAFNRGEELLTEGESDGNGASAARDHAEELRRVLADPELEAMIRRDVAHEIQRRGGEDGLVLLEYPDERLVGLTLREIAREWDLAPVDAVFELQFRGDDERRGGGRIRGFSLSEADIEAYAAREWVATASDAGVALPGEGLPHARFYGNFPRKIAHYARDRGVLTVADAVRSSTSLPARILGLTDRGMVHPGYRADLVVFDLDELEDRTTFFEPHQYPAGIEHVLVGGVFVVEDGELTWALPGEIVTGENR